MFSRSRAIVVAVLLGVSPLLSPLANKLVNSSVPPTHLQVLGLLLVGVAASTATIAAVLFPTPGSRQSSLDKDAETERQKEQDTKNAASS